MAERNVAVRVVDKGRASDVELHVGSATVTIGELLDHLGWSFGWAGSERLDRGDLRPVVDVVERGAMLSTEPCPPGRGFAAGGEGATAHTASVDRVAIEVAVVAGLDAGRLDQLGPGAYRLGAAGDPRGWCLEVPEEATRTATTHGVAEYSDWLTSAAGIEVIPASDTVVTVAKPVRSHGGHAGFLHRPPRSIPVDPVEPIPIPAGPQSPTPAPALSWAAMLGPLPIGIVMAIFFRPIFALFALMGPVIALGRWVEGKRRFRKAERAHAEALSALSVAIELARNEQAVQSARLRWQRCPHVAELWRRARQRSPRLWERRREQPDFLELMLAVGSDLTEPAVEAGRLDAITAPLGAPLPLGPVPRVVDLEAARGIGLSGERSSCLAVARSLALQAASLHGPADVRVGLLCSIDRRNEWDWLKWLPHLKPGAVGHDIASLLHSFGSIEGVLLLVVDHPAPDIAALERAARDYEVDLRVIAVAEQPTSLPAICSVLADLSGAAASISDPRRRLHQGQTIDSWAVGVSPTTASAWARSLAALRDPEFLEPAAAANRSLVETVGAASAEDVLAAWRCGDPTSLVTNLGFTSGAVFGLDLAVDGPHALVAGTTGAGKSELLRTWVVGLAAAHPPTALQFVLVDFKGGGAFDVLAELPHVVGELTDLEPELVDRAIAGLRAELRTREERFRALGVSSFPDAVKASAGPLARLVVVIDEFAVLARDHPEQLDALVDVAARGRSLGIHLVLATQRPSGVIDQKIRANTNLRIALRVQDVMDSHDVIGSPDAAHIDRQTPGRAYVRIAGESASSVQVLHSGRPALEHDPVQVRPFRLFHEPLHEPHGEISLVTELEVAVASIAEAASHFPPLAEHRPVQLWCAPLPAALQHGDLVACVDAASVHPDFAIGLTDLPDERRQAPWCWNPHAGALVVYGAAADLGTAALRTIAAAAVVRPGYWHLYAVDGAQRGLAEIETLKQCGAYIVDDTDRTLRLLQLAERRIEHRSPGAAPLVVLIDNIAAVLARFDELDALQLTERLVAIARDGPAKGVGLAVSARSTRDVPHRLAQIFTDRLVGQLADPTGHLALGLGPRQPPPTARLRVVDAATGRLVQLAETTTFAGLSSSECPGGRRPEPIPTFPTYLTVAELPMSTSKGRLVAVGVDAVDCRPVEVEVDVGDDILVVGPAGRGRSSLLGVVASGSVESSPHALVALVADRRSPLSEVLGTAATPHGRAQDAFAAMQAAAVDGPVVLVVDDIERLDAATASAFNAIVANRPAALTIMVSTTSEVARSMRSPVSDLRSRATMLLLASGTSIDSDIAKLRLPPLAEAGRVIGRGWIVRRGRATSLQFARPSRGAAAPAA